MLHALIIIGFFISVLDLLTLGLDIRAFYDELPLKSIDGSVSKDDGKSGISAANSVLFNFGSLCSGI